MLALGLSTWIRKIHILRITPALTKFFTKMFDDVCPQPALWLA
jgi:hypothetical protein